MKKIFFVFLFTILVTLALGIMFYKFNSSSNKITNRLIEDEEVNLQNNNDQISGDYDFYEEENLLIFYGKNDVIVYSFEDDKLNNVQMMLTLNSNDEANLVKYKYEEYIGEIIKTINVNENIVSIEYNMDYFEEYKNMTQEEVKSILLNEFVVNEIYKD